MTLFGPAGEVISGERVCRGCGCTDSHACEGGCAWACMDVDELTGVCTRCAERLRWHMGLLATVGIDPAGFAQALAALRAQREAA